MGTNTDRITKRYTEGRPLYVQPSSLEERMGFVRFLEEEGYRCTESRTGTRKDIICLKFPVVIMLKEKSISCLNNTVCAAAAVSSGLIMGVSDFRALYLADSAAEK